MAQYIHKKAKRSVGVRILRVCRIFTSFLICWTIILTLTGLAISFAADSQNYHLDADPLDASDVEHGVSNHFQMDGRTTWKEDPVRSTHFQIVHDGDTVATSSSSSSAATDEIPATTNHGPSGGRAHYGTATTEPASSAVTGPQERSDQQQSVSLPTTIPVIGAESIKSPVTTAPGPSNGNNAIPQRSTTMHPAGSVATEDKNGILPFTLGEAIIATRLGMIYRFESVFESIPAYQSTGTMIRSIALGVRPGFMSVESLFFPFAIFRPRRLAKKRKQRPKKDTLPSIS